MVGGDAGRWAALGLHVESGEVDAGTAPSVVIGGVRLRVDSSEPAGLVSVGLLALEPEDPTAADLDGAPIHAVADPPSPSRPADHPARAVAFDHVVLMTPDLDRTCAAVTAALHVPLKRVREAGPVRQGFFRLGEVILEVVESPQVPAGAARWWGLVVNVEDLHAACDHLGPEVIGVPKPAVQPGRFIATVRESLGLGCPVALMSV